MIIYVYIIYNTVVILLEDVIWYHIMISLIPYIKLQCLTMFYCHVTLYYCKFDPCYGFEC